MMERLLDAPAEMLGKGRAYVRHTLAPGVTIGRHTHEHEMESMVIVSGRAVHIINGEEQILEKGDIIAAMPGDTHQIRLPGRRAAGADSHRCCTNKGGASDGTDPQCRCSGQFSAGG